MKRILASAVCLSLAASMASPAVAGGWGTAGKVLTGVVAGSIVYDALRPHPVVAYAPVYPGPSVVYAAPVVQAYPANVYYSYPAPVVVAPPPAVVVAPVVVYRHAGWGRYRRAW